MKKPQKIIFYSFLSILFVLGILFYLSYSPTIVYNIQDNTFGNVEIKMSECKYLCNVFAKQSYYTTKTSYNLGDTITGTSSVSCIGLGPHTAHIQLKIHHLQSAQVDYIKKDVSITGGSVYSSTISFSPQKEGMYLLTHSWSCDSDTSYTTFKDDSTTSNQAIEVARAFTTCDADKFTSWTPIWNYDKDGVNSYRCEEWEKYTLTNGVCFKSVFCKSYLTICSPGYVISGTDLTEKTDTSKLSCSMVQDEPVSPEMSPTDIDVPISDNTVNPDISNQEKENIKEVDWFLVSVITIISILIVILIIVIIRKFQK